MGGNVTADGYNGSFAMGRDVEAEGSNGSIAVGFDATALGEYGTFAQGRNATAEGGNGSFAIGDGAKSTESGAVQFSTGANAYGTSLQIGGGIRIHGDTGATPTRNGDIWLNGGYVYVRSNGSSVKIT
jgi:hypothetical protein